MISMISMINWEEIEDLIINLKYPLSFFYLLNKKYNLFEVYENYDYLCALFMKHHFELFIEYQVEKLLNVDIKDRLINKFIAKLRKVLYFANIYNKIGKSIKNPCKIDLLKYFETKKLIFNNYYGSNYPIYAKYHEYILINNQGFMPIIKEILHNSIKLFGLKFYFNFGIKILSNFDFDLLTGKEKLTYINEFHISTQKALDITIENIKCYYRDKKYIENTFNFKKIHIELIEMDLN
jgi:hypothetical protein